MSGVLRDFPDPMVALEAERDAVVARVAAAYRRLPDEVADGIDFRHDRAIETECDLAFAAGDHLRARRALRSYERVWHDAMEGATR